MIVMMVVMMMLMRIITKMSAKKQETEAAHFLLFLRVSSLLLPWIEFDIIIIELHIFRRMNLQNDKTQLMR